MEPRGTKEGCYAGPVRLRLSRAKVSTLTGEANGKVCLGSLLDSCLLTGSTEQRRGGVGWGGQLGPLTESAGTFAGKGPLRAFTFHSPNKTQLPGLSPLVSIKPSKGFSVGGISEFTVTLPPPPRLYENRVK